MMNSIDSTLGSPLLTREEILLSPYFVKSSRIPVVGSLASASIAIYSLGMATRYSFSSHVVVLRENTGEGTALSEWKNRAFLKLAGFHGVNTFTLGFLACCYREEGTGEKERYSSSSSVDIKSVMRQFGANENKGAS